MYGTSVGNAGAVGGDADRQDAAGLSREGWLAGCAGLVCVRSPQWSEPCGVHGWFQPWCVQGLCQPWAVL
jgi:hypothetical protein